MFSFQKHTGFYTYSALAILIQITCLRLSASICWKLNWILTDLHREYLWPMLCHLTAYTICSQIFCRIHVVNIAEDKQEVTVSRHSQQQIQWRHLKTHSCSRVLEISEPIAQLASRRNSIVCQLEFMLYWQVVLTGTHEHFKQQQVNTPVLSLI